MLPVHMLLKPLTTAELGRRNDPCGTSHGAAPRVGWVPGRWRSMPIARGCVPMWCGL